MARVSRTQFASDLATKINDNTSGDVSPQDVREMLTDLEDSAVWFDEGLQFFVENATGSTITKGSPVYISGAGTTYPQVALADAGAAATMPCIGIAAEDILNASTGLVASGGKITDIDTSGFTIGDGLYVSDTAGALTATAPAGAADILQVVAYVAKVNAATGEIIVRPEASGQRVIEVHEIALSDNTTALTTGAAKETWRAPYAITVTDVRASVTTAPTGADIIVDINDGGVSIMTTNKLTIDAGSETSVGSASPHTLTDTALADDAEITFDIDQIGSTVAGAGLKVKIYGYRT